MPDFGLLHCFVTAYNDSEDYMTTRTTQDEQNVRRAQVQTSLHKTLSRTPNVALAFLFGSFAKGTASADSDVDVAVLFDEMPDAYRINALRDRLATVLKADVDIVVLNSASPIIRMQVLKYGVVICRKTEAAYNNFYVDTFNQYTDLKMIRKSAEENILRGRIYA